jgi:D-alanine-D-alanine ligase
MMPLQESALPKPEEISVALLTGGPSSEDYLSRRSAEVVHKALHEQGFQTFILDWQKDGSVLRKNSPEGIITQSWRNIAACFSGLIVDVVFNALHGEMENAGQLQGFFEILDIPITGNGLRSSVIGHDKLLTKDIFRELEVPCPKDIWLGFLHSYSQENALKKIYQSGLDFPLILKATHGGSSESIELVKSKEDLAMTIEQWSLKHELQDKGLFLEEYIHGEEYCVGVFGNWQQRDSLKILPVSKVDYKGEIFDKNTKYEDTYKVSCNEYLDKSVSDKMSSYALRIHNYLRFMGFSRMDFRLKGDIAYALEVNTHPGLSPFSIIPHMISCSEISLPDSLCAMIYWAMESRI